MKIVVFESEKKYTYIVRSNRKKSIVLALTGFHNSPGDESNRTGESFDLIRSQQTRLLVRREGVREISKM